MINPFVIMREVENAYHLKPGSMVSKSRTHTVALARAVAMYLTRNITEYSLVEIGEYFEKDHSTVINNCKKVVKILDSRIQGNTSRIIIELKDKIVGNYHG